MRTYRHLQDMFVGNKDIADKGIIFINGSDNETFISYREMYHRALSVLQGLRDAGVREGQELLFQLDDNLAFVEIFWACMAGGMISVPVTVGDNDESRMKVFKVWGSLKDPYLVYNGSIADGLMLFAANDPAFAGQLENMKRRSLDAAKLSNGGDAAIAMEPHPENIALIQYSSGSTGDPKGVTLTHVNLLSNAGAIAERWSIEPSESTLSWMPLTHDMGLIGLHLTSTLMQVNQYIMPAKLFIRNPLLWIDKAHEHRVQILVAPNFGYKYLMSFTKKEADRQWDLSQVQYINNGAEPVSQEVVDRFMMLMGKYGMKRTAMKPVYGLAEGSVGVCMQRREDGPRFIAIDFASLKVGQPVRMAEAGHPRVMRYADVGCPIDSCEVRIAGRNGNRLDDYTLGHIQIKGTSVTQGYYNNPVATGRVIGPDGWLDTGDLGFMYDGRLVAVGREKEVLFVNGQNIFPHDIERVAEEVDGVEMWNVAVCGGMNPSTGSEDVLLFLQFRKKNMEAFQKLAGEVKAHIHREMGVLIDLVLPAKSIPKTTSGKIQRYKLARQYKNGEFDSAIAELAAIKAGKAPDAQESTVLKLSRICEEVLGVRLGMDDPFNALGVSSLVLSKITEKLSAKYGVEVAVTDLYKYPTIAKLSRLIDRGGSTVIPTVGLPESYFSAAGHGGESFRTALDPVTGAQLRNVARQADVGVGDLLMAVFVYVLKELSGENPVAVQIAINEQQMASVAFDFETLDTLDAVCGHLRTQTELYARHPIQDLEYVRKDPDKFRVAPLLAKHPVRPVNHKWHEVFDVILEIAEKEDSIGILCDYDNKRLNKHKVKEWMTQYVMLLDDIAIQSNVGSE